MPKQEGPVEVALSGLPALGNTGYTKTMKTAVSIPDDLFDAIDECARRLRISRSGLLALAARQFIAVRQLPADATRAWNAAIRKGGQPGDDPASKAMRRRSKRVIREHR
jgi:predicted transcriptional regulator